MIQGINHITISIENVEQSIRFYKDILGCKLVAKWSTGAYLLAGSTWIALFKDSNFKKEVKREYSHIAFTVSQNDFKSICKKIIKSGVKIWQENKSEGDSLYFLDPNGHKLEIHVSDLKSRIKSMKKNPWDEIVFYE